MSEDPLADMKALRWLLERLERSWRDGDEASLRSCFHPEVVFAGPEHAEIARGREACAGSYLDFAKAATIHSYTAGEPRIRFWETTAVVTYPWTMDYEVDGTRSVERGEDLLVLENSGPGWRVVWRGISARPAEPQLSVG